MANSTFGAEYALFAPFAAPEVEDAAPTYVEPFSLGGFVSITETPNVSTGQLYSDNKETLRRDAISSYTLALVTDGIDNERSSDLYGSAYDEATGEVGRDTDDKPPLGGYGYIRNIGTEDGDFYKGMFYPKAKAAPTADGANTQGQSVTYGTTSATLTALKAKHKLTKLRAESKNFETREEAVAWLDGKFGYAPAP